MSRFEKTQRRPGVTSVITSSPEPVARTFNGAPGFERDPQGELFLLAAQVMVDEKTYYEKDAARRTRFQQLVWHCAVAHEAWTFEFLRWLRQDANVRSASIAGACEFVHGRWFVQQELSLRGLPQESLDPSLGRRVIDAVCQRGDEPAEVLAYWTSTYGKPIPAAVRRGVSDASTRIYSEYVAGKYDGERRAWRLGDVAMLTHPRPKADWQSDLFGHVVGKRLGKSEIVHESTTPMVYARQQLESLPVEQRRALIESPDGPDAIKAAGMPWEAVAGWLQGPMDAAAWEACIPSMPLFALLRNLRNFDEAGVSDEVALSVASRLSTSEQVRKSGILPMRFLSAYRAVNSLRWLPALERALDASLSNVPVLTGRTLILIDTSASMWHNISEQSELMYADVAQIFGLALAKRIQDSASGSVAEVVSFSSYSRKFELRRGESLLRAIDRWGQEGMNFHSGTETEDAVRKHYTSHSRIICLTDEQANRHGRANVYESVPGSVPCYTFNLDGYQYGHAPSGLKNRHVFGGLSDTVFLMLSALESGRQGKWPWEVAAR